MSPETSNSTMGDRPPDEDRLLAFALGLADDPELEAALAADAQLRARLESLRGELGEVEAQVRAAVPPAEEGWADQSAARWDGLRPYLRVPEAHPTRRRRFGIRALAPALAVAAAIALALGVTLSRGLLTGGSGTSERGGGGSGVSVPTAGEAGGAFDPQYETAAFGTVVVARAAASGHGEQRFDVLRVLKGTAPASVTLDTEAGGSLPSGSLAVLYLHPIAEAAGGTPSPSPAPTAQASGPPKDSGGSPLYGSTPYLYGGEPAAVQPLPAGTRPDDITLP